MGINMISQEEKKKLIDFIYSREKPEGGFSFAKTAPSTLEDIYCTLKALEELHSTPMILKTVNVLFIHA